MFKLLKIELIKLIYNRSFWIIFLLHFVLMVPIVFMLQNVLNNTSFQMNGFDLGKAIASGFKVFEFPDIWNNIIYLASWFKLFLAIVIVVMVCNEYQFKTIKQNIIDGLSKIEIVMAKELLIFLLSLVTVLLIALLVLILGKSDGTNSFFNGSENLLRYFISLILYLNFAYLLSTFIKKSGLTIGVLFLYSLIIENLIAYKLPEQIAGFLPINLISNLTPNPALGYLNAPLAYSFNTAGLFACLLYYLAYIVIVYWCIKRSRF